MIALGRHVVNTLTETTGQRTDKHNQRETANVGDRGKVAQAQSTGDSKRRRTDLDRLAVRLRLRRISLAERYRGDWGEAPRHVG